MGKVWVPSDEIAIKNECKVGVKIGGEKKHRRSRELLQGKRKEKNKSEEQNEGFSLL